MTWKIIEGDCLEVMKTFPDNHFSTIVTDPPYGLHFMGKDWDNFKKSNFDERGDFKQIQGHNRTRRKIGCANSESGAYDPKRDCEFQYFMQQVALEALRITKPGGHCLMFGAPRRYHRQVCALEDAGWEIRDCLMWIFGSGFPKSHNHFGIEGYGTALKPAYEPIIMAMKPCDGTFAQNAEKWGQAGINIDACRIPTKDKLTGSGNAPLKFIGENSRPFHEYAVPLGCNQHSKGRWPANVIFDEEAGKLLDEQSGNLSRATFRKWKNSYESNDVLQHGLKPIEILGGRNDKGGASRFFYCAKTSSRERNEGLKGFPQIEKPLMGEFKENPGRSTPKSSPTARSNHHPTVKPIKLMEYLIKLVMPPSNGLLLDPFAGSGSTILAAKRLGFDAIGIEKQPEYCEIARARLSFEEEIEDQQMELF